MLDIFLTLFTLLFVPTADADALRKSAPSYLTIETAQKHLAAARFAASAYSVDPDLLLSIAYYESRYTVDAVTREQSGKLSCGLTMVTMPLGTPCPAPSLFGGYLAGAEHLHQWLRSYRGDVKRAMLGYAGGWNLATLCTTPQESTSSPPAVCKRVEARHRRAAWIRRLRAPYGV